MALATLLHLGNEVEILQASKYDDFFFLKINSVLSTLHFSMQLRVLPAGVHILRKHIK